MRNGFLDMTGRCARRGLIGFSAVVALGAGAGWAATGQGADTVEVQKIVLAERDLRLGQEQLVQVSLRNTTTRANQAGIQIELRDEKDHRVGAMQQRKVALPPLDEAREFFTFAVPKRQGKFTVRMELFTPDFKARLLSNAPIFYSPFTVLGGPEAPPPPPQAATVGPGGKPGTQPAGPPSFAPPTGLRFERPDLQWENVDVKPPSLLVGEPLRITADLRNVGGDIARNADVSVEYFNARNPGRRIPITKSAVLVVAPGEKVEMEFEAVFPEESQLGDYRVLLTIDPGNKLEESNKENNILVVETPVRLSLIKQVFPEAGFVFEDAGLFLFRWDSRRFDEFKVQVGTNSDFSVQDNFFDLPQGTKWTQAREIVPLEGELPDMATGLMQRQKADRLFWRVMGRDSKTGKTGVSQSLPFQIHLPPGALPAAEQGRSGSAAKPAASQRSGAAEMPGAIGTPGSRLASPPPPSTEPRK